MNILSKNNHFFLMSLALAIGFSGIIQAQMISPIKSLEELRPVFAGLDHKTLVVWDVDDVLVMLPDAIFGAKEENTKVYSDVFGKVFNLPIQDKSIVMSRTTMGKWKLVEDIVVELIIDLQQKDIKTVALTATKIGKSGIIESVEDFRITQLKEFDIDFSGAFTCPEEGLELLPGSLFKKGIMLTGRKHYKGPLLRYFLEKIKENYGEFEFIVFIDDRMDNLINVGETCLDLGITYKGFHYTGALDRCKQVDKALAQLQVDHLLEHEVWLSDDEANFLIAMQEVSIDS